MEREGGGGEASVLVGQKGAWVRWMLFRCWEAEEVEKDWGKGAGRLGRKRWRNLGKEVRRIFESNEEFLRRLFKFQEVVNNVWEGE